MNLNILVEFNIFNAFLSDNGAYLVLNTIDIVDTALWKQIENQNNAFYKVF